MLILNHDSSGNEPKSKESKASSNQSEVQLKEKLLSPKKITAITIKPHSTKKSNAEPSALLSLGAQYRQVLLLRTSCNACYF